MSVIPNPSRISTTIVSNANPLAFPIDTVETKHSLLAARWHAIWRSFVMLYIGKTSPAPGATPQQTTILDAIIEEECGNTPVLRNMAATYRKYVLSQSDSTSTRHFQESVRAAILQMAQPYYEEIWKSLTVEEQLALFHLARDRFIHVEHPGLEPLLRKGLILFDPDLRIMNVSFRKFVQMVGEREELPKQDVQRSNSVWNALKVPLGIGLATIVVVLILTQEELRTALPAVISLLPLLLQNLPDLTKGEIKSS